jgi:hypothetical protein
MVGYLLLFDQIVKKLRFIFSEMVFAEQIP